MKNTDISGVLKFLSFSKKTFLHNLKSLPWLLKDYQTLKKSLRGNSDFPLGKLFLIATDKAEESGHLPRHYFYQDLLVAQKIFKNNPVKHVDIGSRIDGFVAHVASFREIEVVDIRALSKKIPNVRFVQSNLMDKTSSIPIAYTDSLSSLHAIEHFGLGRYNDPIDGYGHIKALDNIYSALMKGGRFYFSTPIGQQRIEFNAHRVFSLDYLLKILLNKYELASFSYLDDNDNLYEDVTITPENKRLNFGCQYGCGIFELVKK